jgi:hypothetical protein
MAEVIHVFSEPVALRGKRYRVQVCGRPADNIWEGWIEFESDDGDVVRSPRETTQPDRAALEYWATGLSFTYFEGALSRALEPPVRERREVATHAFFDGPAPVTYVQPVEADHAVLDPFSVAAKGEELLRSELGALSAWHLRNIVRAYDLADATTPIGAMSRAALVDLITSAVAERMSET